MKKYKFTSPSKSSINCYYKQAKENTYKWLSEYEVLDLNNSKMVDKFDKIDLSLMISLMFPQADLNILELINKFMWIMFIFDDFFENISIKELESIKEARINIMKEKNFSKSFNPYVNNLLYLWKSFFDSFEKLSNEGCKLRFISYLEHYLEGCVEESKIKTNKENLSINDCLDLRIKTFGLFTMFPLIEIEKEIKEDKFLNSLFPLMDIASHQATLINDFYSFSKEKTDGAINYLVLTEKENNLSEEIVKDIVFREIEKLTNRFSENCKEIKKNSEDGNLIAYLDGLSDLISGHSEWFNHTERYEMTDHSFYAEELILT